MTWLIRGELVKLRTARSTWGLLALVGTLALLLGAATSATAGVDGAPALGEPDHLANVLGVSALPGVALLVLGILAMAGEYQHRTITTTLLATPVRGRVLAAKLVVVALAAVPVAVGLMTLALAAALPRLLLDDVAISLASGAALSTVGGNLLAAVLLGVLGVGVGALLRNQLAAVLLVVTWALLGEGILSLMVGPRAARWLPGGAAQAVVAGGDGLLPLGVAALLLALYAGAVALAAGRLTIRRDIV